MPKRNFRWVHVWTSGLKIYWLYDGFMSCFSPPYQEKTILKSENYDRKFLPVSRRPFVDHCPLWLPSILTDAHICFTSFLLFSFLSVSQVREMRTPSALVMGYDTVYLLPFHFPPFYLLPSSLFFSPFRCSCPLSFPMFTFPSPFPSYFVFLPIYYNRLLPSIQGKINWRQSCSTALSLRNSH